MKLILILTPLLLLLSNLTHALSVNEISDLRQQVYAALAVTPQQSKLPKPPVDIPFQPATQVEERIPFQPPTELAKSDVPSLIQSASSAIEEQIASKLPIISS